MSPDNRWIDDDGREHVDLHAHQTLHLSVDLTEGE